MNDIVAYGQLRMTLHSVIGRVEATGTNRTQRISFEGTYSTVKVLAVSIWHNRDDTSCLHGCNLVGAKDDWTSAQGPCDLRPQRHDSFQEAFKGSSTPIKSIEVF